MSLNGVESGGLVFKSDFRFFGPVLNYKKQQVECPNVFDISMMLTSR